MEMPCLERGKIKSAAGATLFVFRPQRRRCLSALDGRSVENAFGVVTAVHEDGMADDENDGALSLRGGLGVDLNRFLGASFDGQSGAFDFAHGAVDVVLNVSGI